MAARYRPAVRRSAVLLAKVERCVERGVELLIDDCPMSITGALEHGIVAATIGHPWNEEICEEEDVICARDWHELARLLAPLLGERTEVSMAAGPA